MADSEPPVDEKHAALVAFLDGELDESAARILEQRSQREPGLRAEAEALKKTWEILAYLPQPEPAATFTSRTNACIRRTK